MVIVRRAKALAGNHNAIFSAAVVCPLFIGLKTANETVAAQPDDRQHPPDQSLSRRSVMDQRRIMVGLVSVPEAATGR